MRPRLSVLVGLSAVVLCAAACRGDPPTGEDREIPPEGTTEVTANDDSPPTFDGEELLAIERTIESELIPEIEKRGGHVSYPARDLDRPSFEGGMPAGRYSNPSASVYEKLVEELHTGAGIPEHVDPDANLVGEPEQRWLPDETRIIAEIGPGPGVRTFQLANTAEIYIPVDIDSNSVSWIAYMASEIDKRYPDRGYATRIVPVRNIAHSVCLPPVVDALFMINVHHNVTDWSPGASSDAEHVESLERFFPSVIEALRCPEAGDSGGRLFLVDSHEHYYPTDKVLQYYHDLFYPTIRLLERVDRRERYALQWKAIYERTATEDLERLARPRARRAYERQFGLAEQGTFAKPATAH